jgi:hypothetical protein
MHRLWQFGPDRAPERQEVMWSPSATFDITTLHEGFVIRHLNGIPPARFEATWLRNAELADVIDAIESLLHQLCEYDDGRETA